MFHRLTPPSSPTPPSSRSPTPTTTPRVSRPTSPNPTSPAAQLPPPPPNPLPDQQSTSINHPAKPTKEALEETLDTDLLDITEKIKTCLKLIPNSCQVDILYINKHGLSYYQSNKDELDKLTPEDLLFDFLFQRRNHMLKTLLAYNDYKTCEDHFNMAILKLKQQEFDHKIFNQEISAIFNIHYDIYNNYKSTAYIRKLFERLLAAVNVHKGEWDRLFKTVEKEIFLTETLKLNFKEFFSLDYLSRFSNESPDFNPFPPDSSKFMPLNLIHVLFCLSLNLRPLLVESPKEDTAIPFRTIIPRAINPDINLAQYLEDDKTYIMVQARARTNLDLKIAFLKNLNQFIEKLLHHLTYKALSTDLIGTAPEQFHIKILSIFSEQIEHSFYSWLSSFAYEVSNNAEYQDLKHVKELVPHSFNRLKKELEIFDLMDFLRNYRYHEEIISRYKELLGYPFKSLDDIETYLHCLDVDTNSLDLDTNSLDLDTNSNFQLIITLHDVTSFYFDKPRGSITFFLDYIVKFVDSATTFEVFQDRLNQLQHPKYKLTQDNLAKFHGLKQDLLQRIDDTSDPKENNTKEAKSYIKSLQEFGIFTVELESVVQEPNSKTTFLKQLTIFYETKKTLLEKHKHHCDIKLCQFLTQTLDDLKSLDQIIQNQNDLLREEAAESSNTHQQKINKKSPKKKKQSNPKSHKTAVPKLTPPSSLISERDTITTNWKKAKEKLQTIAKQNHSLLQLEYFSNFRAKIKQYLKKDDLKSQGIDPQVLQEETEKINALSNEFDLAINKHLYTEFYNQLNQFISSFSSPYFKPTDIVNQLLLDDTICNPPKMISDLAKTPESQEEIKICMTILNPLSAKTKIILPLLTQYYESYTMIKDSKLQLVTKGFKESEIDTYISQSFHSDLTSPALDDDLLIKDTQLLDSINSHFQKIYEHFDSNQEIYAQLNNNISRLSSLNFDGYAIANTFCHSLDPSQSLSDLDPSSLNGIDLFLNSEQLLKKTSLLTQLNSKLDNDVALFEKYQFIYKAFNIFISSNELLHESIKVSSKKTILTQQLRSQAYYKRFDISTLEDLKTPQEILKLTVNINELEKLFKAVKTQYFSQASTFMIQSCIEILIHCRNVQYDPAKQTILKSQMPTIHPSTNLLIDKDKDLRWLLYKLSNLLSQFLYKLDTPIENTVTLTQRNIEYVRLIKQSNPLIKFQEKPLTPKPTRKSTSIAKQP
tara:strand:- start:5605 stop:9243 length:3639 start_codon:yes stop_codon:yes gene_type:complete